MKPRARYHYYINGKKVLKRQWIGNLANGCYQCYYDNGQLMTEHTLKNGHLEGLHGRWSADGKVMFQDTYVNGQRISHQP